MTISFSPSVLPKRAAGAGRPRIESQYQDVVAKLYRDRKADANLTLAATLPDADAVKALDKDLRRVIDVDGNAVSIFTKVDGLTLTFWVTDKVKRARKPKNDAPAETPVETPAAPAKGRRTAK